VTKQIGDIIMTIKITEQKKSVLVRRWVYSPERKRTLPVTIMSVANWKLPKCLTEEQVREFDITADEIETYKKYVSDKSDETAKILKRATARTAIDQVKSIMEALSDPEALESLSDEDIEKLSNNTNDLKKLVTSTKAKRKRVAKSSKKELKLTIKVS
jgi:hypothetical protein